MNITSERTETITFTLTMDPITVRDYRGSDYAVDMIQAEFEYTEVGGPGWNAAITLYGWRLTRKGTRDDRSAGRRFVYAEKYPAELLPFAQALVAEATRGSTTRAALVTDWDLIDPDYYPVPTA